MNGKPIPASSTPVPKRPSTSGATSATASSIVKAKSAPSVKPFAPTPTPSVSKVDPKKPSLHSQRSVVVPSRYLTTKRTEEKTEPDTKLLVVKKNPPLPKDRLRIPSIPSPARLVRPNSSSPVPAPRPIIKKAPGTLTPKFPARTASIKKPPPPKHVGDKPTSDQIKDDRSITSDTNLQNDGTSSSAAGTNNNLNGVNENESHGDVIEDLQGRIRELQGALAALTFERDALQLQLTAEPPSNHDADAGDADEEFDEESVGSMESWDSEMTDERDEKYNDLLRRYHGTLTLLKQRIGLFKSALTEAKTEYDSLYSKHSTLLSQHEAMQQELETLRNLNSKNKPNASVPVVS